MSLKEALEDITSKIDTLAESIQQINVMLDSMNDKISNFKEEDSSEENSSTENVSEEDEGTIETPDGDIDIDTPLEELIEEL